MYNLGQAKSLKMDIIFVSAVRRLETLDLCSHNHCPFIFFTNVYHLNLVLLLFFLSILPKPQISLESCKCSLIILKSNSVKKKYFISYTGRIKNSKNLVVKFNNFIEIVSKAGF